MPKLGVEIKVPVRYDFTEPNVMTLTITDWLFVDVFGVEFQPLWTKDLENEGNILFTPLSKVYLPLCCTFGHSHLLDDFYGTPKPSFLNLLALI